MFVVVIGLLLLLATALSLSVVNNDNNRFVESECRLALSTEEGKQIVANQARVRWARDNHAVDTVNVLWRKTDTTLGLDGEMPRQLDLEFGNVHMRLSQPVLLIVDLVEGSLLSNPKRTTPAKLHVDDAILSINGKSFTTTAEFVALFRSVNDSPEAVAVDSTTQVTLEVIRDFQNQPALEEYERAVVDSVVSRLVFQTKTEAKAAVLDSPVRVWCGVVWCGVVWCGACAD